MNKLDCRGLQCPAPVIQARKFLLDQPDQPLEILVDDQTAGDNIIRLAQSQGYTVDTVLTGEGIVLKLHPGETPASPAKGSGDQGKTIIYISSDEMGNGDQKLGQILLKNFLFTLLDSDRTPDAIYFVNTGVKLTCGGSDALEPLEKLADYGVDIASCGLCLEFFDLKEHLVAGRTTNMLEIVNSLQNAGKLIKP